MTEQALPELAPTSRFQIYASPLVSPGKCAVCGAVNQPVIDFGLNIDFYGAVMLCVTNCLPEAAKAIGMVDSSRVTAAEEGLALSIDAQLKTRNLVAITEESYHAINLAIAGLSDVLFSVDASRVDVVAESADEDFDFADRTTGENKSGPVGSSEQDDNAAVGEGSASVSSSSGDGSSFNL